MPGFELIGDEEFNNVKDVFQKGGGILFRHGFDHLRGDSFKVQEFERKFAIHMNSPFSLAVSSGTAALRVALAALDINNGDEVITQTFTFVATVEAIIESGAKPICADIDNTLNISPESLESLITERTKAVIAVHMLGNPAKLREIHHICKKYNIYLIEDTAWGCGGMLDNRYLGTWGDIGTFSFDFAKAITTGEGGMLCFKDKKLYERAKAWHDHGHENNPSVPRWEDTRSSSGFNFRMMELQAAVGLAQLEKLSSIISTQRMNRDLLWSAISDIEDVILREVPEGSSDTADALVFLLPSKSLALSVRSELLNLGLATKILPEAISWHFAGCWHHMPELELSSSSKEIIDFIPSLNLLSRAVSLPINLKIRPDDPQLLRKAVLNSFS